MASLPDWNSRGHAFLGAFAADPLVFLGRILLAIFFRGLASYVIIGSLVLFSAEVVVVLLTLYFAFEVLDVITRLRWRRFFPPYTAPNEYWPKVSIHVPAHAEPPEMVIKTLTALRNLDYPTYEVIMVDDNTVDDELWRPVLDFCYRNGIKTFHLQNYPGFKSGALNFALSQTAPLSKTLGSLGGFVAGPRPYIDWLVNSARTFIFTTASTPAAAAAARAGLRILRSAEGEALETRLRENVARLRPGHASPIVPILLGDEARAMAISKALRERGLLVPAIRPPTVPAGSSRLRVALSAAHTKEQVEILACALAELGCPAA